MTQVRGVRCVRCILSAAFPGLSFDVDGVCSVCRDTTVATRLDEAIVRASKQVHELFAKRHRPYDAIVCNSGGKDSSYTLALAVQKYGLRVLSFTLDNGFLAPVAMENIQRVTDALGVEQLTYRPSMPFFRKVIRATATLPIYREQTLTRISAGCNACISLVNTMALRIAIEKNIPCILAGFTLGQIPANAIVFRNHFRFLAEGRKESLARLTEAVGAEVDAYYNLPDALLDRVESYPHNINLLCLEALTEEAIIERVSRLGWRKPEGVDGCSSNCELNTFNNYVHERRFGFSPYELELSVLIRKGLMSRAEALAKIGDNPVERLTELAAGLGFSADEHRELGLTARQT